MIPDYAFPIDADKIAERIATIQPREYGKTRNFIDGAVTYLSPYISRGVISTKQVLEAVLERGFRRIEIRKFIQELAWRDYWQLVWIEKGNAINEDLKRAQPLALHTEMPTAILEAQTGIRAIDTAIKKFYATGYLHNHIRMYIASIACNIGRAHWYTPARWMYYRLLDGDWASNALSWQWVAGSNSHKIYLANQENINKYTRSFQQGTFLDIEYDALPPGDIPGPMRQTSMPDLVTNLPKTKEPVIDRGLPSCVYTYYNLDPNWRSGFRANRILILEPSIFNTYPISQKCLDFALALAKQIPGLQVFTGEFSELTSLLPRTDVYYKEHPLDYNMVGIRDQREWLTGIEGYFPSFSKFWKHAERALL